MAKIGLLRGGSESFRSFSSAVRRMVDSLFSKSRSSDAGKFDPEQFIEKELRSVVASISNDRERRQTIPFLELIVFCVIMGKVSKKLAEIKGSEVEEIADIIRPVVEKFIGVGTKVSRQNVADALNSLLNKDMTDMYLLEDKRFSFKIYKDSDMIGVNKVLTKKLVFLVMIRLLCDPQYRGGEDNSITFDLIREKIRETAADVKGIKKYISDVQALFVEERYCDENFRHVLKEIIQLYGESYDTINEHIRTISRMQSIATVEFWPLVTFCAIFCLRLNHSVYPPKYKLSNNVILEKIRELFDKSIGNDEFGVWLDSLESEGLINGNRVVTAKAVPKIDFEVIPSVKCRIQPLKVNLTCKTLLLLYAIYKLRKEFPDDKPVQKVIDDTLRTEFENVEKIIGKEAERSSIWQSEACNNLYAQDLIDEKRNIVVSDINSLPIIVKDLKMSSSDEEDIGTIVNIVKKIKEKNGWQIELAGYVGEKSMPLPESVDEYIELAVNTFSKKNLLTGVIGKKGCPYIPALQEGQMYLWKIFNSYVDNSVQKESGKLYKQVMDFAFGRIYSNEGMFQGSAYKISKSLGLNSDNINCIHEADELWASVKNEEIDKFTETEFAIKDISPNIPGSLRLLLRVFDEISQSKGDILKTIADFRFNRAGNESEKDFAIDPGEFIGRTINAAKNKDGYADRVRKLVEDCCVLDAAEVIRKEFKISDENIIDNSILCIISLEKNSHFKSFNDKINAAIRSKINDFANRELETKQFEKLEEIYKEPIDSLRHNCNTVILGKAKDKIVFKRVKSHLPVYYDGLTKIRRSRLEKINENEFLLDNNIRKLYHDIYEKERDICKVIEDFIQRSNYFNNAGFLIEHEVNEDFADKEAEAKVAEKNKKIDEGNFLRKMLVIVVLYGLYRRVKSDIENSKRKKEDQKEKRKAKQKEKH